MKAILIIDVGNDIDFQKDFAKIRLFTSNGIGISYYNKVKLKPLPKQAICYRVLEEPYWDGWNDCLNKILGEE